MLQRRQSKYSKKLRALGAGALATAMLSALVACSSGGSGEDSGTVSMKLQVAYPKNQAFSIALTEWAELVKEETGGDVNIEVLYDGSQFSITEIRDAVRDGRLEMGAFASAYHAGEYPLTSLGEVPFMTQNIPAQMATFNELHAESEQYQAEFEKQGLVLLSYIPAANSVAVASEPFDSIDFMSGKSMRSLGTSHVALAAVPGANPISVPHPEIYEGLRTGLIDFVATNALDPAITGSFHEIAPHVVDMGAGLWSDQLLTINPETWASLPSDTQEAIEGTFERLPDIVSRAHDQADKAACDILLESGGTATQWPEENTEEWRKLAEEPVKEEWMNRARNAGVENPEEFYEAYLTTIREYEEVYADFVPGIQQCVERSNSQ